MPNIALHQLLGHVTVTRAISRIKTPLSRFQTFFGMQPGGPGSTDVGGKHFGYDVFNRTRAIATGRPPGTGPASRAPQVVGHVSVAAYRAHEKVLLEEERIFRTRPIGGSFGEIDNRGQRYVTRQQDYLAQLFRNNREFMVSRMCRGVFDVKIDGDDWVPVDSGSGHFSVDFQLPSEHKGTQMDLLGDGDIINTSWATTGSADIPHDLLQTNAAFEQLHGRPLRHIWVNSTVMNYVLKNTAMQNLAGTANRTYTTFDPTRITGPDGVEDTGFTVTMEGIPWITWHVYDGGLDVDGSFTKFIPDDYAIFLPDPSPDWAEFYNGSEIVAENVMSAGDERYGLSAWTTRVIDPAGFELKALDIGLPVVYIPKCIVYGKVVF